MGSLAAAVILDRNGRIFQGPATDRRTVMLIREEREIQISILNYHQDDLPHWLLFHLCPVFAAADDRVVYFVAVQVPIPCCAAPAALIGTCRVEVELAAIDTQKRGVEVEETGEAGDWDRQKAAISAEDVVQVLACYNKFTGRLVCRRRYCAASVPAQLNMQIVYASEGFLSLTGYSSHEVLGRNCRFLNGLDTDSKVLNQIRNSPGTTVRNASGKIAFYVGV